MARTYTARLFDEDGEPTDETITFAKKAEREAFLAVAPPWREDD